MRENREILSVPRPGRGLGRLGKGKTRTPSMDADRKSDIGIVLTKLANKPTKSGGGAGGGKADDQRESETAGPVPDAELGK